MDVRTIDVAGRRLRAATSPGSPGSIPLFFFNGIGSNLEIVGGFAAEMQAFGIGVVAFDVPGTGGSTGVAAPYRFSWLADLAERVLAALGIEGPVDVAGVSWGGALAQEFTRRHPARVRRLVLAATTAGSVSVPGRLPALLKMVSPRRYIDRNFILRVGATLYGGKVRRDRKLLAEFAQVLRPARGSGYYFQLLAGIGWTSAHWLHTLRQPTLVMVGRDDPIIPAVNGRILAALIPQARLVTIDDGHLFLLTSSRECAPIIADFLTRQERPSENAAPVAAG